MDAATRPSTIEQVQAFMACVYEPDDIIEIRRLVHDTATGKTHSTGSTFHSAKKLADAIPSLLTVNRLATNIHPGVLPRAAAGGMNDADVALARVVFADFDNTEPGVARERLRLADLPMPTLTMWSGHGVHFYWRLDEPILDLKFWSLIQKRLAYLLSSDPSVHNPGRVMRLPGFRNNKPPLADAYIIEADPLRTYSVDDFTAALDNAQEPLAESPAPKENGNGHVKADVVVSDKANRCGLIARGMAYAGKLPSVSSGRNVTAFPLAAMLVNDLQLTEDEAMLVASAWNAGNDPPLEDEELRGIIRNAGSYAKREVGYATRFDVRPLNVPQHLRQKPALGPGSIRSLRVMADSYPCLRAPVIHGILRRGESMNVIAPPKAGKSWLVNNLALCVATGLPWLDNQVEGGKVLILDNELHAETSTHRINKLASAMKLSPDQYADDLHIVNLRGSLKDLVGMGSLFYGINPETYRLVIIDAFYRALPASADENSNGDMASLYNLIDSYADHLGCSFVLIHHASKGVQSGKAVTDVGSGAGSISRAVDAHLILRQHQDDGVFVLDGAVRSWPRFEPVCLRWNWPLWSVDKWRDPSHLRDEKARKKPDTGPLPEPPDPPSDGKPSPSELKYKSRCEWFANLCTDGGYAVKNVLIGKLDARGEKLTERDVRSLLDGAISYGFIEVEVDGKVKRYRRKR